MITKHDMCKFVGVSDLFTLTDGVVLDKGSHLSLIPKSKLPVNAYTPISGAQVRGISSSVEIIGHFMAREVRLGDLGECILRDVRFDVVDTNSIPIIIGQGILGAPHAKMACYNYDANILEITTQADVHYKINLAEQLPPHMGCSANTVLHASGPDVPSSDPPSPPPNEPESKPKPTGKDLVQWAINELGVKINTTNMKEAIGLASCLWDNQLVFGSDENYGHYSKPITIPTRGDPIACRSRPVAQALSAKVDQELERLLKLGVIEKCGGSEWLSPLIAVPKKDKDDIRLVVDFSRSLNLRLGGTEAYPPPATDDIFNELRPGRKYFGSMDLFMGYHQLSIIESDRHKTAFTHNGQVYQYIRAPMGLRHTGNVFCRALQKHVQNSRKLKKIKIDFAIFD